ncbi:MAG: hypothetical protein Q4D98_08845 [Planctomycetia bacterium]|nr:hypothetical protein [Planctomycetia bacterium]
MERRAALFCWMLGVLSGLLGAGEVTVGTEGLWKPGYWVPIHSDVAWEPGTTAVVSDSDGIPVTTRLEEKTGTLSVRPGNTQTRVEILSGGTRQTVVFPEPVASERSVVLVVGRTTAGVERAVENLHIPGKKRPYVHRLSGAGQLPGDLRCWELFDAILVSTWDDAVWKTWTPEKLRLLETWVRRGGFLVLSVGKNGAELAKNDAWKPFFPGVFEKVMPLPQTSAMEHFAQGTVPVPQWGTSDAAKIPATRLRNWGKRTRVEVSQYDLPLVYRTWWDFGRVTFAAVDLEHEAMTRWGDRGRFVARLLGYTDRSADYEERPAAGMHHGYDDMAGQFRGALDTFSVRVVSFWTLSLIFAAYLAVIGPGCFYLCRKLRRYGEAASWGVFLASVLGLCLLFVGGSRNGGPAFRMNRVALTDVNQETGQIRQALWGDLWSERAARWDLSVVPDGGEGELAWFGLPGPFLGGMGSRLTTDRKTVGYTLSGRVEGIPLAAHATRTFCGKRFRTTAEITPDVPFCFGTLRDEDAIPYGEVENPLDVPLERCVLFYNGWGYDLGTLQAGEKRTIDERLRRYDVSSMLVEEVVMERDSNIKNEKNLHRIHLPYDRGSRDREYILKTMMFYMAAGGRSYTGLDNQYQRWIDASPLLDVGAAVLFGVVSTPSSNPRLFADFQVSCGGTPTTPEGDTLRFLRVFLPVTPVVSEEKK